MNTYNNWCWNKIAKRVALLVKNESGITKEISKKDFLKLSPQKQTELAKMHPELAAEIAILDTEGFAEGGAQDANDIRNDAAQPGAVFPVAYNDQGEAIGYITGYDFISDDNAEDLAEALDNITVYTNESPEKIYADLIKAEKKDKVHYTSNFHVSESAGKEKPKAVFKLIVEYFKILQEKGYEYVAADMMSDSWNLVFRSGEIRKDRLKKFGIELIATIPANAVGGYSSWHEGAYLALFKIK